MGNSKEVRAFCKPVNTLDNSFIIKDNGDVYAPIFRAGEPTHRKMSCSEALAFNRKHADAKS